MAELKFQVELDDSKIEQQVSNLGKKIDGALSDTLSRSLIDKVKELRSVTPKTLVDENAVKTIRNSINALDQLDEKSKSTAKRIAELRKQSTDLTKAKTHLNNQFYTGAISGEGYNKALSAVEAQQRQVSLSLQDVNREIKQSIQLETAAAGSLQQARIQLAQMNAEIVKMGGAMDGSNAEVDQMIAKQKELYKAVSDMEQRMGIHQRNVGNYASGWNGMQNSINQVMRELPAFTYSAQTGFMAISNNIPILVDELNRASDANKALNAEGKKGVPVWKQLVGSLLSWQSAMMIGITLMTVYGKEIGNFFASLFKGTEAINQSIDRLKLLNDVRKDAAKGAANEIASLQSLTSVAKDNTRSMDERRRAASKIQEIAKSYEKTISTEKILIGQLKDEYKDLTVAILEAAKSKAAQTKIEENAAKRLDVEFEIAAIKEANEARKETIRLEGDRRTVMRKGSAMDDLPMEVIVETVEERQAASDRYTQNEIDNANKRIQAIQKEDEFLQKFVKVAEENKPTSSTRGIENAYNRLADSSKDLLQKIIDLDKEYARKLMESDEAEMQGLRDKFAKFRRLIEEENAKIRAYNQKNSKIKGYQPLPLIDVGVVQPIEDRATEDLAYTQSTTRLEKELDKRKQIFADYEDYRNRLGKEKADERFRDQLQGYETYLQYLEDIQSQEQASFGAVQSGTATAGQQSRVKMIMDEAEEAKRAEEKLTTTLLASMLTYEQKRNNLIEKFQEERNRIAATATQEELDVFDKNHQDSLNALDDTNIQQLDSYKQLFDGIKDLSDAAARKVIANARKMLEVNKNASESEVKKIQAEILRAEQALDDRLPARVSDIAKSFAEMANDIADVNEGLSTMLSGLSDILSAVVQVDKGIDGLKSGLANYQANKADGGGGILGTISAVAGVAGPVGQIVGAVSSVVSGVVKFFKASRESARQAAEEIKRYQQSVLAGELEYNRVLRERAREQQNINDLTSKEIKLRQELLSDQNSSASRDYQAMLMRIQREGQQITGQKTEKYGGFLGIGRKTRVVDTTAELAGKTYEEIEKLYTSNKLTEATKKQFEQLQKLKDEVDDIAKLWDDAQAELVSRMSGGVTANAITNTIITGFKNGKRAVRDFADDMEQVIQDALLSALAYTYLDEPLKKLVEDFQKSAQDGLDANEITSFQEGYNQIIETGLKGLDTIEKTLGITVGGNSSSGTIKGQGIESMTEKSSQEFKANFRSIN